MTLRLCASAIKINFNICRSNKSEVLEALGDLEVLDGLEYLVFPARPR